MSCEWQASAGRLIRPDVSTGRVRFLLAARCRPLLRARPLSSTAGAALHAGGRQHNSARSCLGAAWEAAWSTMHRAGREAAGHRAAPMPHAGEPALPGRHRPSLCVLQPSQSCTDLPTSTHMPRQSSPLRSQRRHCLPRWCMHARPGSTLWLQAAGVVRQDCGAPGDACATSVVRTSRQGTAPQTCLTDVDGIKRELSFCPQ